MRKTRTPTSAFYSETLDKNGLNKFISDYYPINFVAKDDFVFYRTLWQKPNHSTGFFLANNNTNPQYVTALNFLENAANAEYDRELAFLNNYASKNEDIAELLDSFHTDGPNKYINLINALNLALKGKKIYERELNKEIERINKRQEILRRDINAAKEKRYVNVKKGKNKQKLTSEEYRIRNELNGDDMFGDTVLNPYFNLDGKKIFDSMFKKNTDFSIIAEHIITEYGARLFNLRSSKFNLNKQQVTAMIKILISKAYEMLVIQFQQGVKKMPNESSSARKQRINQQLNTLTERGGLLDTFIEDFFNSPDPAAVLSSIAEQNHIPTDNDAANFQALGASTKVLNARIKEMWQREKRAGHTTDTYRQWRKKNELQEKDIEQFVYMMAHVEVETYYTNEGMSLVDLTQNGMSAILGNDRNAPTDINAGYLICTFDYSENPGAKEKIIEAQKKLSQVQQEMIQEQTKITDKTSYLKNLEAIKVMEDKQLQIINELKQDLLAFGLDANDLISHINIHGTIKGYSSIDATTDAFAGAKFGTRISDQIEIINTMLEEGGISPLDADWLIFAAINCGDGMIGMKNKHALEDYLSGFASLLMFSDASIIAEDTQKNLQNNMPGTIDNIHLYILNNTYVPSSYILHETFLAMDKFIYELNTTNFNGTNLTLSTYSSPNANKIYPQASWTPETLQSGQAWRSEGDAALEATYFKMHFLSHFLRLLNNLKDQLPH